jgi:hypothetical protein
LITQKQAQRAADAAQAYQNQQRNEKNEYALEAGLLIELVDLLLHYLLL